MNELSEGLTTRKIGLSDLSFTDLNAALTATHARIDATLGSMNGHNDDKLFKQLNLWQSICDKIDNEINERLTSLQ